MKKEIHNIVCKEVNGSFIVTGVVSVLGVVSGIGNSIDEAQEDIINRLRLIYGEL